MQVLEEQDAARERQFGHPCHNRYKLLLCNSENSNMAWWNKNN